MKDFETIWRGVFGRKYEVYDVVHTQDPLKQFQKTQKQKGQCPARYREHEYKRSALTFALLGVGALLSGLFILVVDPYNLIYEWKVTFGPGGEIFSIWEKPKVDLFLKVYLWNVTNKEEYLSGKDDKLKFQEVGPYVYRELMTHENVTFNDNGTLSSIPNHPLVWDAEMSGERREDDLLILPNIALLSIADVVSKKGMFTRLGLNVIIRQTKTEALVKMTAKEFMFGYKSTLMNLGNTFMPSWIYFDKLGLIDRMYEFSGDFETFFAGPEHGRANIGLLDTYNGETRIPQWESPCGDIVGASDGTKFAGYLKPNDTVLFFRKSMCRAKQMIHVNDSNIDGFPVYVYNFANDTDDNGRVLEKNRCFCKAKNIDQCLPKGLLDVRGCYYGFPIALSYPHFYKSDPIVLKKVASGVNPDPEKHRSYVALEPHSGMPVKLAIRYQINMALGNLQNIANAEKFSDMVLPLLWTENGMYGLPDNLKLRFKLYLQILPTGQTCLMYAFFLCSACFLLHSLRKSLASRRLHLQNRSPWIEDDLVLNIDRKLSSYIPEKNSPLTSKELEVYFNSLVTPLNQTLDEDKGFEEQ